jgi:hypothetical protein
MGLWLVSDLGVGRGEEMCLEAGLEDGEGLGYIRIRCWFLGNMSSLWVFRCLLVEHIRSKSKWIYIIYYTRITVFIRA